mmetsp:Transcript_528/g.1644  ORF Transcript_528/g.1644 Transcript_528/m.1644 type:complete len:249 (+) Transcript_528:86-832(+)
MTSYVCMRVCIKPSTPLLVPSFNMPWKTASAARLWARKADSGYKTIDTPFAASSSKCHKSVLPNSVKLASNGVFGMALANFSYWSRSVTASANMQSAPPSSTYALQRATAASRPSSAKASVRAMITMSVAPFLAAASRATISSVGTTCLLGRCPQRLANTWSSMCTAPAPACSMSRTVRSMFSAEAPKPVSMSTSAGAVVTRVILLTSTSTSSSVVTPRSGTPRFERATPPPLMYKALKPTFCAMRAV